jgi:hypothetical protein
MIDADPNKPLSQWANRPGKPDKLTVIDSASEESIIDVRWWTECQLAESQASDSTIMALAGHESKKIPEH